jgi:hypothetical protein
MGTEETVRENVDKKKKKEILDALLLALVPTFAGETSFQSSPRPPFFCNLATSTLDTPSPHHVVCKRVVESGARVHALLLLVCSCLLCAACLVNLEMGTCVKRKWRTTSRKDDVIGEKKKRTENK